MSVQKLSNNPDIFITEKALDHIRCFLRTGDSSEERRYIAVIEWCERSRNLSSEFTADLIALKRQLTEQELAIELTKRADEHAKPLPPHISLGAIEPWKCSKDEMVNFNDIDLCIKKDTFRGVIMHDNLIDLSEDNTLVLRDV